MADNTLLPANELLLALINRDNGSALTTSLVDLGAPAASQEVGKNTAVAVTAKAGSGYTGAVTVDYPCTTSADCAVKNVGNCCGAMPACVNKDSPTDPQGVQAQCAASGRMSVCGFADVTACQCVSGRCESDSSSSTLPAR